MLSPEPQKPASTAKVLAGVAGVAVLLAANYFLRHTLEQADQRIYAFLPKFYPEATEMIFSPSFPAWRLLLPIRALTGAWTTTGLIVTHLLEVHLTPPGVWYLYNALLIVTSMLASYAVLRSWVFSYTFAICMGFGTQLHAAYAVTGGMALYLFYVYIECVLLSAFYVIYGQSHRWAWRAAFLLSLLLMALCYEGWLDVFVFMCLAAVPIAVVAVRTKHEEWLPGLRFVLVAVCLVAVSYIYVKTHYGYGQTRGAESDVVFNYPSWTPAIEDVGSNVLTHLYMGVTNFLPPSFVSSQALYQLGGDRLVELQYGYHAPFTYLVPMHYLFLWRYAAGAVAVVFCYAFWIACRRLWRAGSVDALMLVVFLIMLATGGPTHDLIKARPFNAMPLLTYHVIVGVLGASLLIAYAMLQARTWLPNATSAVVLCCTWGVVFYGALARPAFMGHEAAQVGMGEGTEPDPMATLLRYVGVTRPAPGGAASYQLMRYSPDAARVLAVEQGKPVTSLPPIAAVNVGDGLVPLPMTLPQLTMWRAGSGVTVSTRGDAVVLNGDRTSAGYQLVSPPVAIAPGHQAVVRLLGTLEEGKACVGVLSADGRRWLAAPDVSGRADVNFDAGENRTMSVVIANCNPTERGNLPTRLVVRSLTLGVFQGRES